jgi:hypothetical protein
MSSQMCSAGCKQLQFKGTQVAQDGWQRSPVVAVIAIIALIGAGYFIFSSGGGTGNSVFAGSKYFLDLSSGELVTSDSMKSPIQVGGQEAVRAHVFSCTSCEDVNSRFIGYLRSFTPDANAAMDIPDEQREPFVIQSGTLVSGYSDEADWQPAWVQAETGPGMMIQETARAKCGDQFVECMP